MKTVGIIGGLGPETTSKFYLELIFLCRNHKEKSYPPILINSIPLPFDIEEDAIARGRGEERCLPFLIRAAQSLEKGGAEFLVMPCNSLHIFIDDIRKSVTIPMLSIVEETINFLKRDPLSEVGVVSTSITRSKKLYENALLASNIHQVSPDDPQQAQIGKIVHNLVSEKSVATDKEELMQIINDLEKNGAEQIILACTDLQLLTPTHPRLKIHDTMKILAIATANEIVSKS